MKIEELEALAEKADKENSNVEIFGETHTVNLLWQLTKHRHEIIALVKAAKKVYIQETVGEPYSAGSIDELGRALAAFEEKK